MKKEEKRLRAWLPPRPPDSHKGDFGHLLLVACSRGMAGAGILAARAAYRAGAGLVTLAVPRSLQDVVAGQVPEALTLGLPQTPGGGLAAAAGGLLRARAESGRCNALAVGPGLGQDPETGRALIGILGSLKLPAVVDADGLNLLSRRPRARVRALFEGRGAPCVLTPHPAEMGRLLSRPTAQVQAARQQAARALARELGCVALLKGKGTIVTDGERSLVNPTGNPGLAKGATGDVLTGVIAGLWAQRLKLDEGDRGFEAAALGAWLHGAAADAAVKRTTAVSLIASDVVEALPEAFRKLGAR